MSIEKAISPRGEMAWRLLEPCVRRDQATIVCHKGYTFRSLIANTWRKNRLIIAGDAAHVMPPFMGQGMCAGLRDDWNLAWKLDLILTGQADDALLDTYQVERAPHASDITDLSMYLGKVICIADPEMAARRDKAFFEKTVEPSPPFPSLTGDLLDKDTNGKIVGPAGLLAPHGTVCHHGQLGRLDDLVGLGFVLILRNIAHAAGVMPADRAFLAVLNGNIVHLEDQGDEGVGKGIVDIDNKLTHFMDEYRLAAMLVKPNFYIFGGAKNTTDISALINRLSDDLGRYGVVRAKANSKKLASQM